MAKAPNQSPNEEEMAIMRDLEAIASRRREERRSEFLRLVFGLVIIYLACIGTYFYWQTISERIIESTGDYALLVAGGTLLVVVFYVGLRIVISSISVKKRCDTGGRS